MMGEFKREERFIVVKRKHLSDWPDYETIWQMIKERCTGRAAKPGDEQAVGEGLERALWLVNAVEANVLASHPKQAGQLHEVWRILTALRAAKPADEGLRELLREASDALAPFAKEAEDYDTEGPDAWGDDDWHAEDMHERLTVGALRQAETVKATIDAALEQAKSASTEQGEGA